jgi:electron transfer flavoprotein beta subunit
MSVVAIAVCLKWVDRRSEVDPLTAAVHTDPRTSGASDADEAALETALLLADAWTAPGRPTVTVVTAGGAESEPMLRDALTAGAARAVRVELAAGAPSDTVAAALADVVAGADLVVCGAWSLDRGSGAVPAFLAARLGAAQALGLVLVTPGGPGAITADRRLDGGRREQLDVTAPAVLSVEAGTARLRRGSLDAVLAAAHAPIHVVTPALPAGAGPEPHRRAPFRPRPLALPAPAGADARARVLQLTGANVDRSPARVLTVTPAEGADAILEQLRAWGYLA